MKLHNIHAVGEHNIELLLPLIREYQSFYQVSEIDDVKNRQFFSQFGLDSAQGCQFLVELDKRAVGFATVYYSFSSTIAEKVAVLNDLYTLEPYRGQGIARRLVDYCWKFSQERGAVRLQWLTAPENEAAQRLYDSMDTGRSVWCFYTYNK